MDKIIRTITSDGAIMAAAIDSSDLVYTAQQLHHTSPVATAALGRLLTGASMMGTLLKKDDATITLKINGGGPAGQCCRNRPTAKAMYAVMLITPKWIFRWPQTANWP